MPLDRQTLHVTSQLSSGIWQVLQWHSHWPCNAVIPCSYRMQKYTKVMCSKQAETFILRSYNVRLCILNLIQMLNLKEAS